MSDYGYLDETEIGDFIQCFYTETGGQMVEFFDYELTHFMQGTTKAIEQSVSKKEMLEFMMDTY